jgi:hypothetical protein
MPARCGVGTFGRVVWSLVIIAVFCFVPLDLLFQNIEYSAGAQDLTDPATVAQPTDGDFGYATPVYWSGTSQVCVAFEFLGLDSATSDASLGVVISATAPGVTSIDEYVNEGYSGGVLVISSNFGLSSITIPFLLSQVDKASDVGSACVDDRPAPYQRGDGFREDVAAFSLGQPRAFPNDWYELDDGVHVYLCPPGTAGDSCAPSTIQSSAPILSNQLQLTTSIIATTRDQDLSMTVATGRRSQFQFVVDRPTLFVVYTYWIAAMPFILILAVFLAGVLSAWAKKAKKGDAATEYRPERTVPAVYEIVFGVAAALVAILPLRAVLIPSSLPSLTRLDIFFGTGSALLVALSVTWIFVWGPPGRARPRREGGGDPAGRGDSGAAVNPGAETLALRKI